MRVAVRKWGNSLALRIPKAFADGARIESGSEVELSLEEGRLVVTPLSPAETLASLLAQVTDDNRHAEVVTGPAVGEEVW